VIIGTPAGRMPLINFQTAKEAIAKGSRDYFACHENSASMRQLQSSLGGEAALIGEEDVNQTV
jgi:hypothetical protein